MNKKDDYYFPHFCSARHNRKIRRIRKELGIEGYAIYFMLLEVLRAQSEFKYPYSDIDLLADEFSTSEQKIKVVIANYDLFQIDESNNFFSEKLIFYLQPYLEKRERARFAVLKRWENQRLSTENTIENKELNTNEIQMYNKCNTNEIQSKVKNSKVKNSKVEEYIVRPKDLEMVESYFKEKGYPEGEAERFFNHYESNGWKVGQNPMKKWHFAAANWNKNKFENKGTNNANQSDYQKRRDFAEIDLEQSKREFREELVSGKISGYN